MKKNKKKADFVQNSAVLAAFEAAKDSRRTSGWYASAGGPNVDVRSAWSWLVKRHQDLVDNDGYAKKAVGVIVNNWIGDGIMSTPTNTAKRYTKLWQSWCDEPMSDFYEKRNWYGNQASGARTTAVRGAVLIRRKVYPELLERYGLVPLQVQMLEPDWLDFSKDNGYDIVFGQQYDNDGRLKGYWIRDKHPGESMLGTGVRIQSTFVSKEEISLHFEDLRTGARMGIPFGTAAILTLRDMGDTRAAQQLKDKISACFFGVTTDSEGQPNPTKKEEVFEEIEPGMNYQLPPGKQFQTFSPPGSGDFRTTNKVYAQNVAAAYEITYEALTGDLSDVNYSSMRGGWLEFSRRVAHLRGNITYPGMLSPVCRWHDDLARMAGLLKGPRVEWTHTPPRREMMDPTKEIPALIDAIKGGIMSLSEVHRSYGFIPEQVMEELGQDLARARAKGLTLSVDLAAQNPPAPAGSTSPTEPATVSPSESQQL
ncbi:MAG: phage portal protein [Cyanobacteriota bacterium]